MKSRYWHEDYIHYMSQTNNYIAQKLKQLLYQ